MGCTGRKGKLPLALEVGPSSVFTSRNLSHCGWGEVLQKSSCCEVNFWLCDGIEPARNVRPISLIHHVMNEFALRYQPHTM